MFRFGLQHAISSGCYLMAIPVWSASLLIVFGCAEQSIREVDKWSSGAGSNCHSVVFNYTARFEDLDAVVGTNLVPLRLSDDRSILRLAFVYCDSAGGWDDTIEAQVLIALDPGRLPVQLAGSHAWDAYVLHLANHGSMSHRLMDQNRVAALRANVSLEVSPATGIAVGKLEFADGSVTARTILGCDRAAFMQSRMLMGTGTEYSVLFGNESGVRCAVDENALAIEGLTPFAGVNLEPRGAVWVPELRWDYTVWRNVAMQGVFVENR